MVHDEDFIFKSYMAELAKGRQQSGYDKMLLIYNKLGIEFDVYLLRFPIGSEILPHRDSVQSGRHFRLNIILKKSKFGGSLFVKSIF